MLEAFQRMGLNRVALNWVRGRRCAALGWRNCFPEAGSIEAVDTTGAGDCFDAGFTYAWLRGMDPKHCLKAGTVCGEMSARAMGGIAAFPTKEELERILCPAK